MQSGCDVKVVGQQLGAVSVVGPRLALRDVSLYVQKEARDVPLPEAAECLAADALLRICGLRFELRERRNAEYMSPSGRAPFLTCGSDIVSDVEAIARYLSGRGVPACSRRDGADGPRLRALSALLRRSLAAAELRVCWLHEATRRALTDPRVSARHPWPLCRFVAFQKRRRALHWLRAVDGAREGATFSLEQLYDQVDRVCSALSSQLGDADFFFGDGATELEALLYGHLYMLLTVPVPLGEPPLAKVVCQYPNLLSLVSRMDHELFHRSTAFWLIERPEVLLPVLVASSDSLGVRRSDASTCTRDDGGGGGDGDGDGGGGGEGESEGEPPERSSRYCPVCMMTLSTGAPSSVDLRASYSDASTCTRDDYDVQGDPQPAPGMARSDSLAMVRGTAVGVCGQPCGEFFDVAEIARREAEVDVKLATLIQLTAALLLLVALTTLERWV